MGLIETAIGPSGFELVRDRIASILLDEIETQFLLSYDTDLEAIGKIWVDRIIPFDKEELPAINVSLAKGDYDNKSRDGIRGAYVYNIDFFANSKKVGDDAGDKLANSKIQKLMRVVRGILENVIYETLQFNKPFIERVYVSSILIAQPNPKEDALTSAMSRMLFNVVLTEKTSPVSAIVLGNYITAVKLYETDEGYFYAKPEPVI